MDQSVTLKAVCHFTCLTFWCVCWCLSDPSICNTAFAAFIHTREFVSGYSLLVADDRVHYESTEHYILRGFSAFVIIGIACGLPIIVGLVLRRAYLNGPPPDLALQHRVAKDFDKNLDEAQSLIEDIRLGSSHGFLVAAYRRDMYMWYRI